VPQELEEGVTPLRRCGGRLWQRRQARRRQRRSGRRRRSVGDRLRQRRRARVDGGGATAWGQLGCSARGLQRRQRGGLGGRQLLHCRRDVLEAERDVFLVLLICAMIRFKGQDIEARQRSVRQSRQSGHWELRDWQPTSVRGKVFTCQQLPAKTHESHFTSKVGAQVGGVDVVGLQHCQDRRLLRCQLQGIRLGCHTLWRRPCRFLHALLVRHGAGIQGELVCSALPGMHPSACRQHMEDCWRADVLGKLETQTWTYSVGVFCRKLSRARAECLSQLNHGTWAAAL